MLRFRYVPDRRVASGDAFLLNPWCRRWSSAERVGMEARPNRYEELTDLQRAAVDRLINAVAAGRLELVSDACPSAVPVCRPRDLVWATS